MIKRIIMKVKKYFSLQYWAVLRFNKVDGDNTLRFNYPLSEDDLVFDVGGYKGDFAAGIISKYNCNVWIFEPVPQFYEQICKRFYGNNKVKVFCLGLEKEDKNETIILNEDGSSSYKEYDIINTVDVQYVSVASFWEKEAVNQVSLMKINIEGGEYDLLEAMIDNKLINKVDNFQIQFHNIKKIDSLRRMKNIQRQLKITHQITWKFRPYIWENWKIINADN